MSPLFAIGYRLSATAPDAFRITATYVRSEAEIGWVRTPQTWDFGYPSVNGIPRRFGTSETLGLLGGVKNEKQFLYSESCERAIGDILTTIVCEILDAEDLSGSGAKVVIFGLALPKVVGRVLSLRPPEAVEIAWLCPRPFPEWMAEGVNESAIIGLHGWGIDTEWDDERVLVSTLSEPEDGCLLVFQQLCQWGVNKEVSIPKRKHVKGDICKAQLPREVIVAAEQIEVELTAAYSHEAEEPLRRPPNSVGSLGYEALQGQQGQWPPGWPFKWSQPN